MGMNNISTPIQLINAARIFVGLRPIDMLRDLENGTYVSDHEFVWKWSDDFKAKMIELLANSVFIKL